MRRRRPTDRKADTAATTSPPRTESTAQLQRTLDSLYDQAGLLGHGLLALGRANALESVARSIAHQILHLATRGLVRLVDDRTIQSATDPASENLRPDERLLLRLLFTDRVDRIPVRTASFAADYKGGHQVATWAHLVGPVRRSADEELRRAGWARTRPVSARGCLRALGVLCFFPGLSGTLVLAQTTGGASLSPAVAIGLCYGALAGAGVAWFAPSTDWFLTGEGRRVRDAARTYAGRLREILAREDPLPPDQASLSFYEQALPFAMLHGFGPEWEDRLREHFALDTNRHSVLLDDPPAHGLAALAGAIVGTIAPLRPPGADSGGGGGGGG
ncbi:hypothetical protein CLM62_06425 [Streptomyces sp. SA15]|uniref:DUF2207 family protein n=1 Tax=Streptomyces sp. SA15 TaxID=934019 RepID=UPI000BAF47C3|nr:DUF2207 domain-containing protein [Streptomyces sp. SA15]PAZ16582.1 hypothetical protein CLM62_06425 [Streptomyces sp. SA15]